MSPPTMLIRVSLPTMSRVSIAFAWRYKRMGRYSLALTIVSTGCAFLLGSLTASAQWSVLVEEGKSPKDAFASDDPRRALPGNLFQPFTKQEWDSSNFAPPTDTARFQDWRYGMFIHFGLSTCKAKELSWGTVQSIKW